MRLDQGEEHEELHPALAHLAGTELRDEGQRLDHARAEFRAEWEAKLQEKRRQAESARRREVGWAHFGDWIHLRGLLFGGGLGALVGLYFKSLLGAVVFAAAGALIVGIVEVPLLILSLVCKVWFGLYAERLEGELHAAERAEVPSEAVPDSRTHPDAQPAFPAELQAEILEKWRQAKLAQRRRLWWNAATWKIFCTGASASVLLGLFAAFFTEQSYALAANLTVGLALLTLPLLSLAGFCEWCWTRRAERLEREAKELECSQGARETMPDHRNQPDRERLSRPISAEGMTRNAHGQSLDDAQEAFRTEWQAKVDRKRSEAAQALQREQWWESLPRRVLPGSALLGALCGLLFCVSTGAMALLPLLIVALALSGSALAIPLAAVAAACRIYQQRRAARLEREARKLESS